MMQEDFRKVLKKVWAQKISVEDAKIVLALTLRKLSPVAPPAVQTESK